jgi:hypothetical protein
MVKAMVLLLAPTKVVTPMVIGGRGPWETTPHDPH